MVGKNKLFPTQHHHTFYNDIYNRYFAREKKVESMLKNNASSIERGKKDETLIV